MKYPIGIQTFEDIRRDGFVYVDKTELVYNLSHWSGKYFFLIRPRRFGKSLLVSTMEAYFLGRKDLFEGLAIATLEKDWLEHPVLRIDFSGKSYTKSDDLEHYLDKQLSLLEARYSISRKQDSVDLRFQNVIEGTHAATGRQVVILIDEYDKPIVDNLTNPELAEVFQTQLQGFYSVMKSQDAHIRLGFLTGVTKLGKLSVFSGLNNLMDISMNAAFNGICGITEAELKATFPDSISEMASYNDITVEECYEKLALTYDGYRFHPRAEGVYNPFSLLNALSSKEFGHFWFETGTPSFLVRMLRQGNYLLDDITQDMVPASRLTGSNYEAPDVITLMYQAGYLTIKNFDTRFSLYTLGYPNLEVENGFLQSLSQFYIPAAEIRSEFSSYRFVKDIESGDTDSFLHRLESFFADMDYSLQGNLELYFQNTMYVLFKLLGQQVQVERHTSNGRIDVVVQTPQYVYLIELKRDQSPEAALEQIAQKGYDKPFLSGGRTIFRIGINFCSETRRIAGWKVVE